MLSSMLKRSAMIAGMAASLLLGSVAIAPGSQAAVITPPCPKGWFCAWSGKNYTGTRFKVAHSYSLKNDAFDNRMKSVYNNTGKSVSIFRDSIKNPRLPIPKKNPCSTIPAFMARNLAGTAVNSISSIVVDFKC